MKTFKLIKLQEGVGYVNLQSTDPEVLQELISQVQPYFPKLKVHSVNELDSEEAYSVSLGNVKERDISTEQAFWLIMKYLGQQGWEPFSAWGGDYFFRKAEESQQE